MSGRKRLSEAVHGLSSAKRDKDEYIPGILGLDFEGERTVAVENRDGYVWVRLRRNLSEVVQAYNDQVSPVHDLPVLLVRDDYDPTRYRVVGRDLGAYKDWGTSAYLPVHGNQHSFNRASGGGGDIVWVFGRQMMPLLAYPSGTNGSNVVFINELTYYQGTSWTYAPTQLSPDLLALKPSGTQGAVMALLYLDAAASPTLLAGNFFDATLTGTADVIPHLPSFPDAYGIPVAGIRMVTGTSSILWDNIYDVRPWIIGDGFIPTGTVAGHTIQDEGVNRPYRTNLNFTGDIVWALDDAGNNQTDIIISGSAAGFNQDIYDNGGLEGTDLDLDFALGLDVALTGTSRVDINAHVFEEDDKGLVRKKSYGGNARGDHAVDLQSYRDNAAYVASADKATIGGGDSNKASGHASTVAGGTLGAAEGTGAFVGGGYGNTASGNYSVVGGGENHDASGYRSFVGGGSLNVATATGTVIGGGLSNAADGEASSVLGGDQNTANANLSYASGKYAYADRLGEDARAVGRFVTAGDAQRMEFLLYGDTSDATNTELFLGDVSGQRMTIPDYSAWGFEALIIAKSTNIGEAKHWKVVGGLEHSLSLQMINSTKTIIADTGETWDVEMKADTGNQSLYLGVSGGSSDSIHWFARVLVVGVVNELS